MKKWETQNMFYLPQYVSNKKISLVVFAIAVCVIIALIVMLGIKATGISDVYGTYVAGDEKSETAVYYVFNENGDFAYYSQFDEIHSGAYSIKEINEDISFIEANVEDNTLEFYVYKGKECVGIEGKSFSAEKISELPTFINVNNIW